MAYNDSDQMSPQNGHSLGNYSFVLEVDTTTGGPAIEVTARCTNTKTGKIGTKTKQLNAGIQVVGWYVDANDTTADVYATIRKPKGSGRSSQLDTSPLPQPISITGGITSYRYKWDSKQKIWVFNRSETLSAPAIITYDLNDNGVHTQAILCGPTGSTGSRTYVNKYGNTSTTTFTFGENLTIDGKSVGWISTGCGSLNPGSYKYSEMESLYPDVKALSYSPNISRICWTAIYGTPSGTYGDPEDVLIGRFAIDPEEDPIDPDDPDYPDPDDPDYPDPIYPDDPDYPDPDDPDYPGDQDGDGEPDPYQPPYYPPTKTLYLTVTGALSGRHNDPLTDLFVKDGEYKPYVPTDKETIKSHGCGGDGGHGGGGGAGASTVVVHKFATSKANSKEITAIARRHGYGSGGGKGGKGGSGCIIIYY